MTAAHAPKRKRYVPMDVNVAFGPFGTKLDLKWGMEGLCSWMLLLAAAKREPNQGTFTFTSETEAWTKIGATATGFSFGEFITFCGRNKQTRKTVSGRVSYVEITGWEQWNDEFRTQSDSERKSRKRAVSTQDRTATPHGQTRDSSRTECEVEVEGEYEGDYRPVEDSSEEEQTGLKGLAAAAALVAAIRPEFRDDGTRQIVFAAARDLPATDLDQVRHDLEASRDTVRNDGKWVNGALDRIARKRHAGAV